VFHGRLNDGETASFWVSVTAPDEIDGIVDDRVTFVLRQSVVPVPEPGGVTLLFVGFIATLTYYARFKAAILPRAMR
jgi:hypothetical protein